MNTLEDTNMKAAESYAIVFMMHSMMSSFTKSEKKIVTVIEKDPEKVIYSSIADMAANCKVSEPTVIRFCRKLGLNGYQDLKLKLAKELVNPLQAINENITKEDNTSTIVSKVFNSTVETLTLTKENLSLPDLEAAVDLLTGAARITVIGMGNSHAICLDLQHKLLRLGLNVTAYSDPHLAAISIAHKDENDVLFCISHSGSSKEIVDLAMQAKEHNAKVISITNTGISPLSKYSTITLHTCSNETKYRILGRESRIAELAIIDSIYTMISLKYNSNDFLDVENALKYHKY